MSSIDNRQNSANDGVQLADLITQLSPVEQLPFPDYAPFTASSPAGTRPLSEPTTASPAVTDRLPEFFVSPTITRTLPEVHTGTLPSARTTTTSLRMPVVIRGGGKKSTGIMRPPPARRSVVHIAVLGVILLLTFGTAMAAAPAGSEAGHGFGLFQPVINLIQSHGGSPNLVAQQAAATATAVVRQDGYDPSGQSQTNQSQTNNGQSQTNNGQSQANGGPTINPVPVSDGNGGPGRFAFGQCTYWANMRYHALTGFWVPWSGNAYQWAYGAATSGWVVSSTPHVPSIIVLQPYVQGAGGYGHVAVVERINPDGSVYTSNYNWYANGGWDTLSYWTFQPGAGVTFVWRP